MSHQERAEIRQGTLALMILKTLESMGPLHGYGIARRIEQTSGDLLAVPYGTIYPALVKLEQEGFVVARWDVSENNRKAKYYELTRAGRKHIHDEARLWEQTVNIMARFFDPEKETA
jgi:PadR family transcriptional regulator, regulatory protein PadR